MQNRRSTVKPISDLKSHTGFWLRFVSNHLSQKFARRLDGSGVTVAEWVILREMFDAEIVSPSLLASVTGLTRGAVSKLIERLREKKLLIRTESAEDCEDGVTRLAIVANCRRNRRFSASSSFTLFCRA